MSFFKNPNGYPKVPLIEVASLQRGYDLPIQNRVNGSVPIYAANGQNGNHNQAKATGPGVVTGRSGTIGKVHYVEGDYWPLNTSLYVTDFHGNHPKWVYYMLQAFKLERFVEGAGVPTLNRNLVHGELIPLPPLAEQKRIAAILDKSDSLRRKNQQAIQLADKFLRAVFLDLFGDPVTNPKGWEKVKLGDVIFFAKDGPHVSPNYSEKGIPFLSTRHVRPTGVIWEDLKYITNDEARNHWKKCKPEYGDILYTKGGTTGIACPVDFKTDFAVWVHVALLRPNAKKVNFIWLAHMLNSTYCYNQSQKHTRGATNKDLGLTRMVEICMCCPPLDEQEKFVKIKESVTHVIQQNNILTEKLLFESLSQKAFAGEL